MNLPRALLALLWISGNTNVIRMLALGFVLYVMYRQYSRSQGGSGGGQAPEDNSSRGHAAGTAWCQEVSSGFCWL